MEKVKPTQNLPQSYRQIGQLNLEENRGLAMILNLAGIGLLFGVGWLLMESLVILRPEYLADENIFIITGMREFWRSLLVLVVSLGLMVLLNEGIRLILFWMVTRQRPQVGIRGFHTYAMAPDWYLPQGDYLLVRLLPILAVTLLGLAAVPIVHINLVPGVLLLIALNIAASINDLATAYWLLRRPKHALVLDRGDDLRLFYLETADDQEPAKP